MVKYYVYYVKSLKWDWSLLGLVTKYREYDFSFLYLISATRAGSPQQQIQPISVGLYYLTHPINFPCRKKPGYPEEIHELIDWK